jgi:putative ABC transport system permease protein
MNLAEIIRTAIGNTFRSRLRTTLTVLAIFVGAFTLTLTNGIGTGIRNYISSQTSSLGGDDLITVVKASLREGGGFGASSEGPTEYDPDKTMLTGGPGFSFEALTSADIAAIESIPGIIEAEPLRIVAPDYVQFRDGPRYELPVNPAPPELSVDLVAGSYFAARGTYSDAGVGEPAGELYLPVAFVEPLGFASPAEATGNEVTIGITDAFGAQHELTARVAGVQQASLFGDSALLSHDLSQALFSAQTTGLPDAVTGVYQSATARFALGASAAQLDAIKEALAAEGLSGMTMADQLGSFQTVLDAIIGVLNAFAMIALVAAGFGIINTLLMSVQERTREIGLMKAMGLGAGKIFVLFSAEAVFIGFLGSAIGSVVAIALGSVISNVLANGLLSDLQGLRILSFDWVSVVGVIVLVMLIAFLAGTLPARSAARLDPIDALRYE